MSDVASEQQVMEQASAIHTSANKTKPDAPAPKRAKIAHEKKQTVAKKVKDTSDVTAAMKGKKISTGHTASSVVQKKADTVQNKTAAVSADAQSNADLMSTTQNEASDKTDATSSNLTVSTEGTTGETLPVQNSTSQDVDSTFGSVSDLGPNVVMCMRTLQAAQWRTLADALKDLVPECAVKFDKTGLKIVSMDLGHVALIHLHAISEFYYCKEEITVGLNVLALYRMLRNLTTAGYLLEFTLTSDNPDHLQVIVTNTDKRTVTRNNLKLLRLPDESIHIPTTIFHRVLSMPATDFQRYIRELSAVSQEITIKSTDNVLILSANGACGSTSIEIQPTAKGMHWSHIKQGGDGNVVKGVFHSKYLERFARPLDNEVELFIKQDYPLIIRYVMASAVIRLVIAPVNEDEEAGAEHEMDNAVM